MDFGKYQDIAEFVSSNLKESDWQHTHRVFNYALQIAETENESNFEVVSLAALLHDIGRVRSSQNHAKKGSAKAYELLIDQGYSKDLAREVAECILSHSIGSETEPQTLEAKILFDADKLDMTGAIGAARAIGYAKSRRKPLYLLDEDGFPMKGKKKEESSLLRDYKQELEKITGIFYTEKARKIAIKHQKTMDCYFEELYKEVDKNHKNGIKLIQKYCK